MRFGLNPGPIDSEHTMSAVAVFAPIVIASWPALGAAVASAATSLGFSIVDQAIASANPSQNTEGTQRVDLEIPGSEVVLGTLGRDQRIRLVRDGVEAIFARDARGRASVCVTGDGYSEEDLRQVGEELSGRMVQHYVLQKLKSELDSRGMNLVEETVDENQAIRLRVRHWQN